jgi:hypothetical protein
MYSITKGLLLNWSIVSVYHEKRDEKRLIKVHAQCMLVVFVEF